MTDAELLAQLTPTTVIRFANLCGAVVAVNALREERLIGDARLVFAARCAGCLESYEQDRYIPAIHHPRTWAAKHAANCRALPQSETNAQ